MFKVFVIIYIGLITQPVVGLGPQNNYDHLATNHTTNLNALSSALGESFMFLSNHYSSDHNLLQLKDNSKAIESASKRAKSSNSRTTDASHVGSAYGTSNAPVGPYGGKPKNVGIADKSKSGNASEAGAGGGFWGAAIFPWQILGKTPSAQHNTGTTDPIVNAKVMGITATVTDMAASLVTPLNWNIDKSVMVQDGGIGQFATLDEDRPSLLTSPSNPMLASSMFTSGVFGMNSMVRGENDNNGESVKRLLESIKRLGLCSVTVEAIY
jgi:hypothetical protein